MTVTVCVVIVMFILTSKQTCTDEKQETVYRLLVLNVKREN